MEKLLLLLSVTLAAGYFTDDGDFVDRHIILKNGGRCLMSKNIRGLVDDFHNHLRQEVALGHNYLGKQFVAQEMTGLIYDCELEREAQKEQEHPGSAAALKLGVIKFKREYTKSALDAVRDGLKALVNDNNKLRQLTNPRATRFGCFVRLARIPPNNARGVDVVCVYDKKTRRKDAQTPRGESCCVEHNCYRIKECTFYKNSKCLWDLCYVAEDGEVIESLA